MALKTTSETKVLEENSAVEPIEDYPYVSDEEMKELTELYGDLLFEDHDPKDYIKIN